jgi:hypothetical protein
MFKGIATAAFGFGVIMTVALMVSETASTAAVVMPNTTIVKKNMVFPLKDRMTLDTCAIAYCADV